MRRTTVKKRNRRRRSRAAYIAPDGVHVLRAPYIQLHLVQVILHGGEICICQDTCDSVYSQSAGSVPRCYQCRLALTVSSLWKALDAVLYQLRPRRSHAIEVHLQMIAQTPLLQAADQRWACTYNNDLARYVAQVLADHRR